LSYALFSPNYGIIVLKITTKAKTKAKKIKNKKQKRK
jgi:hypothetical protein